MLVFMIFISSLSNIFISRFFHSLYIVNTILKFQILFVKQTAIFLIGATDPNIRGPTVPDLNQCVSKRIFVVRRGVTPMEIEIAPRTDTWKARLYVSFKNIVEPPFMGSGTNQRQLFCQSRSASVSGSILTLCHQVFSFPRSCSAR